LKAQDAHWRQLHPPDALAELLLEAPPHLDSDAPETWWEILDLEPPYPCQVWQFRHPDGRHRPFNCGRWRCPICSWRKAREWRDLIEWAPVERHVVITRIAADSHECWHRLKNIVKAIRRGEAVETADGRRRPRLFEYLATAEKHSAAGIHVHLLTHGDYLHKPLFSAMLDRYGAGRITWLERLDGPTRSRSLARYITRHLIQYEHPYQPKCGNRVRYSRRFWLDGTAVELRAALAAHRPTQPGWILETEHGLKVERRRTP
jgi:hypothetical protein